MESISIRKTFANKHILFAGGSGFLGKVWLVNILDRVPDIGKIYVLLRKNGSSSALERFENMVNTSYVFKPLHDKHGPQLGDYLSRKVEVILGDTTLPDLGITPGIARRLHKDIDLVINCVGLVDFNPDVREAISTNIDGSIHCANFVEKCREAALLHISTCYVVGNQHGRMPETLDWSRAPSGKLFHAEREYRELRAAAESLAKFTESPAFEKELRTKLSKRVAKDGSKRKPQPHEDRMLQVLKRKEIRDRMVGEGLKRAKERGWPNTYTYTKALAEALLESRRGRIPFAVFRPSIVECSVEYPFPGWNEGFNTSGPLAYLLGSWFRNLPARVGNPFDVVPVDLVSNGMTIASAELMLRRNAEVYHCGTSDLNLFTIERACELTALGHRIHLRKHGKTLLERTVLSRWDAKAVDMKSHFTVGNLSAAASSVNRFLSRIPKTNIGPIRRTLGRITESLGRTERKLKQTDEMLGLFLPFIHDNDQVFQCRNLQIRRVEEEEFRFSPQEIHWRDYWLKVHMPGLRRWCFPAIEGREKEILKPEFRATLNDQSGETETAAVPTRPATRTLRAVN